MSNKLTFVVGAFVSARGPTAPRNRQGRHADNVARGGGVSSPARVACSVASVAGVFAVVAPAPTPSLHWCHRCCCAGIFANRRRRHCRCPLPPSNAAVHQRRHPPPPQSKVISLSPSPRRSPMPPSNADTLPPPSNAPTTTSTTAVELTVVQQQHHHQRTNGSTNVKTFKSVNANALKHLLA